LNLAELYLTPWNITQGIDVLRAMKSLKAINVGVTVNERFSAEQFWKKYDGGEFK